MASKTLPASDIIVSKVNGAGAAAYSTLVKTKWHAEEQNATYGRLVGATYSIDAFDLWLGGQQVISGTTVTAENPQGGPDLYGRQFYFSGATGAKPWADGATQGAGWYGGKSAFYAGLAGGTQWDDASIGTGAVNFGTNNTTSATRSMALGYGNTIAGSTSIGLGSYHNVIDSDCVAIGMFGANQFSGSVVIGSGYDATDTLSAIENFAVSIGVQSSVPTILVRTVATGAGAVGQVGIALGATLPTARLDVLASSTSYASLRLRHGTAPSSPNDGDVWTTTAGVYARVNGSTVGPLIDMSGVSTAFSGISSGTNTTAAMVLGNGSSLTVSGTGTNNATTLLGSTWAAPAAIGTGTPAAATFTDATLGTSSTLTWTSRTKLTAPSDGIVYITKNDGTSTNVGIGFGDDAADARIYQNGGASIAITRNDAGGFASVYCGEVRASGMLLTTTGGSYFGDSNRALFSASADGTLNLYNSGGSVPGALRANAAIAAKTSAYPVVAADTGTTFTDEGAGGTFAFTLPTAVAGYQYTFIRTTANTITITAAAADTIQVDTSVTAGAGSITLDSDGASVTLRAINSTEWIAISLMGAVTV